MGHIVAFDFASHGFLASHSVIKKHLSSVLQLSDKEKEKFADYKGRENVFWAAWVRIRTNWGESRSILEKGMDYIQRSHL